MLLLLLCWAFATALSSPANQPIPDLKLIKAYSVEPATKEWPKNLEPSGLTMLNGRLYAITDKQENIVWEVKLEGEIARFYPHKFTLPKDAPHYMDYEGLCPLPNGHLAIVSEEIDRLVEVNLQTGKSQWIGPAFTKEAQAAGLFQIENAHAEGVGALGPGHFLIAAERQPRGLIEIDLNVKPPRIIPTVMNFSRFPLPLLRFTDFADLWVEKGRVFALCRNAGGISELIRTDRGWREKPLWRFRRTVESAPYRFENMIFGLAEGMCFDATKIYLTLDNNRTSRAGHPGDSRSWLFVFERPKK